MTTGSTKSWLKGKPPQRVSVKRIRPTNTLSEDVRGIPYTPILLAEADDGLYYIVDGNHRFFRKLVLGDYHETIPAWVLEEGDQQSLQGYPLPQNVREWKTGQITLAKLSLRARAAYKDIEEEVRGTLKYYQVLTTDKMRAKSPSSADQRAYAIAEAVVRLIKTTSTIEEEARRLAVPIEELASIHKCFLNGGIKAIRDRLRSE